MVADVVIGHRPAAIEVTPAATDFVEFEYVWHSKKSFERRAEFARERPMCRFYDLAIVIDGEPLFLTAEDLLRLPSLLRRRK